MTTLCSLNLTKGLLCIHLLLVVFIEKLNKFSKAQ